MKYQFLFILKLNYTVFLIEFSIIKILYKDSTNLGYTTSFKLFSNPDLSILTYSIEDDSKFMQIKAFDVFEK